MHFVLNTASLIDGKKFHFDFAIQNEIIFYVNSIINQLLQEGFIKTESCIVNNGNKKLLISVNEYQTYENILKMDYKIINNYKCYYNEQLNNIKNKYKAKTKQDEDLVKLTYIIDQICENILIMKFFWFILMKKKLYTYIIYAKT